MPPILGNIIVIAIIVAILVVCGKNVVEMIRGELKGSGCAGCSGGCSCSGCSSCGSKPSDPKQTR
ncbi:MAG: FeoB-associated Cys-rich membrane protein [Lachnospiraceae bacterium]|nr:FeoB-associated Cys-rich membrane protein [Lachnospiraceae bacterium]